MNQKYDLHCSYFCINLLNMLRFACVLSRYAWRESNFIFTWNVVFSHTNEMTLFLTWLLCVIVSIRNIKEVRPGKGTEVMRNKEIADAFSEDCTFSLIYGDEFESLDLVALSPEEANIWITGLNFLIGASKCKSVTITAGHRRILSGCSCSSNAEYQHGTQMHHC